MTAQELRKKYFDFFTAKGHKIIPSAPLIPENDPTVLFTTAGMHPLIPFLLGERHPAGKKLVSVQKCIRTADIEEVGDDTHLTFFEMLGNWSLGDYFKKEAIEWSFEFLTSKKWLGLEKEKLAVSVFAGDKDAPFDEEAYGLWKNLVISEKRIAKLPKKNNWWGPAGETGPCGPDSEMFYWIGQTEAPEIFDPEDSQWVEIWNDVFMQYNKTKEGKYEVLKQQNVDTGMGLERTFAILNNEPSVYETELFKDIVLVIRKLASLEDYESSFDRLYNAGSIVNQEVDNLKERAEKMLSIRIIADHIKAAVFILAEGLEPSNTERGYVLRRLIRRAVRYGKLLGINHSFTFQVAQPIIGIYQDVYPELLKNKDFIEEQLIREEEKFSKTLEQGLKELRVLENQLASITGRQGFDLYQSYGFPKEMIREEARKVSENFDQEFAEALKKHQELSRTASAGMFKAGLADHSEIAIKYHTATHLLQQALRDVLGREVGQKGSNINAERLRFDFSYGQKMTAEQIKKVEDIVNEKINEALPAMLKEMSLAEAKASGAIGLFAEKYGDRVKVYSIGDYSKEICGGPHVQNTKELGHFKIIKEEAVSQGVRRIKAVLE
ncbi:MAG TPA: alanine--tRNA ligase [Candidatus Paceibacterota bacterium]|nr:alanine--tRNA ligase [Candidatus Paceibacterota bacterium]